MKYQPPFGSADPNAPYVDRNTPGAIRGSAVPGAAIEDPQRELAALILACGLVPSDTDLFQVLRAFRSQRPNWVATVGGTANALTITLDPAPASLADLVGVPLRIKAALANTSASVTLSVNGLAATQIIRLADTLRVGDIVAGAIIEVVFDGTIFRALALPKYGVSSGPGWVRLGDSPGTLIQYGSLGTSAAGPVTISVLAYSSANYRVFITDESSPASPVGMSVFGTADYTTTSFKVFGTRDFTNYTSDSANWFTIGT